MNPIQAWKVNVVALGYPCNNQATDPNLLPEDAFTTAEMTANKLEQSHPMVTITICPGIAGRHHIYVSWI